MYAASYSLGSLDKVKVQWLMMKFRRALFVYDIKEIAASQKHEGTTESVTSMCTVFSL